MFLTFKKYIVSTVSTDVTIDKLAAVVLTHPSGTINLHETFDQNQLASAKSELIAKRDANLITLSIVEEELSNRRRGYHVHILDDDLVMTVEDEPFQYLSVNRDPEPSDKVNVYLPDVTLADGYFYRLYNRTPAGGEKSTLTLLDSTGTETIDELRRGEVLELHSDGTEWSLFRSN